MMTTKPRFPVRQLVLYGWLPSPLKKVLYRLKGYRIGKGVRLGFGSLIIGSDVSVGASTELGLFCFVRGRSIRLGEHVQIGAASMIDTPEIDIGDGTKINEQVFVGGLQFPESRLVIGRNCQIMQMTFINPTRSIVIGDDTGIGGDCLLFGHTSWLSRFEGYPVEFEDIRIGNSVSIAWRVFVLPGTQIGDGAVVGANSLVRGVVPPRCLAVGFPARVVAREPEFPRTLSGADREAILWDIVDELVTRLRGEGVACQRDGSVLDVSCRTTVWPMRRMVSQRLYVAAGPLDPSLAAGANVVLSLPRLPSGARAALGDAGSVWFDIEAKERSEGSNLLAEETALHLRRHGVRFFRVKGS